MFVLFLIIVHNHLEFFLTTTTKPLFHQQLLTGVHIEEEDTQRET